MSVAKSESLSNSEINVFDLQLPYTYKCQVCPFFANDQNTVSNHYQAAHCQPQTTRIISVGPVECKPDLLHCNQCNYTTQKKGNLNAHVNQMHVADQRPYPCPHCDYRAKTERHLHAHIPTHGGETPPFKCNFCAYETSDRSELVRHKQEVHESDKVFSCEQCTYKARTSDYLAKHKVTQHTPLDERQFQCNHCSKRFAIESLLRRHLKKHLDNTRHNCPHCGNAFKDIRRHRSRCAKAPEKDHTKPKEPKEPAKSRNQRKNEAAAAIANVGANEVVVPQLVQMPSIDLSSVLSLQGSLKGVNLNSMISMNQSQLLLGSPLVSTVRVLPVDIDGVSVQST